MSKHEDCASYSEEMAVMPSYAARLGAMRWLKNQFEPRTDLQGGLVSSAYIYNVSWQRRAYRAESVLVSNGRAHECDCQATLPFSVLEVVLLLEQVALDLRVLQLLQISI